MFTANASMVKLLKCIPNPLPFHSNKLLFLSLQSRRHIFYSVFYSQAPVLRKRLLGTLSLFGTITDETVIVRHCWDRSLWQMANWRTTIRWLRQIKSLGSILSLACVIFPPCLCACDPCAWLENKNSSVRYCEEHSQAYVSLHAMML